MTLIIRADVGKNTIFDEGYEIGYTIPKSDIKDWNTVKFDATKWIKGISGIGYSDNDDNTIVPSGIASVYVRYYFDVPNAKDVREITFWMDYDDAYVLWLNDVEVGRSDNIKNVAPKGVPGWNEPIGKIVDHESTDTPAGKPNAARWARAEGVAGGQIMKHTVEYDFGGDAQKGVGAKPTVEGGGDEGGGGVVETVNAPIYLKDNILAAGIYNNSAGSSDMSLIIKLDAGGKTIIDEGSEMVYIVPDADIKGWNEVKFNDSGWQEGISGIGYSDNDDNTPLPGWVPSVYTRYQFDIPNAKDVKNMTFTLDYDDAYILWLNGVEVARSINISTIAPGGVPGFKETLEKITDHEATDLPAGKPNAGRWKTTIGWAGGQISQHIVPASFKGASPMPVEPAGKLSTTWGNIKFTK